MCPAADGTDERNGRLAHQNDPWKFLVSKGASVVRPDDGMISGQKILDWLIDRSRPVMHDIQRGIVDQGLKLGDTSAGREVQEELERLEEAH